MVLSLRKRNNLKVRQPLQKIMIPTPNQEFIFQIESVEKLILSEVNVKKIEFLSPQNNILIKKAKANFKTLGPKYGQKMKAIALSLEQLSQDRISEIERDGKIYIDINGEKIELLTSDVDIVTQDIPGWVVLNEGNITVALDTTITESLLREAIARELVNRIQNIRKDKNFEITDFINVEIEYNSLLEQTIEEYRDYITGETLTQELSLVRKSDNFSLFMGNHKMESVSKIDVIEGIELEINISKV
jgi:isoleucyl-tRNA synthetase